MARFQNLGALAAAATLAGVLSPTQAQTPPADPARFDGHRVVRAELRSLRDVRTLTALSDDPWTCGWDGVSPGQVDFRIAPEAMAALRESGVPFTVLIDDVQALIDAERRADAAPVGVAARGPGGEPWFDDFQPLAAVSARVDALVASHPALASRVLIGRSIEQRDIFAIRITSAAASVGTPKPAIVINGGQHAREWITVMASMYLAEHLLTTYPADERTRRLLDAFDWYIVPVMNPDGYEFSWQPGQRMWRKNRRVHDDGTFGVDTNRNWGAGWGGPGASTNTGSDIYRGSEAFSEPETQAMRDFLLGLPSVLFTCDVHSYSQLILTPRGFEFALPSDAATFHRVSLVMQQAMYAYAGRTYSPGPVFRNIYPASGGACDWASQGVGALGTSFELRDEGQFGFLLPADQIVPASIECRDGLLAAADHLLSTPIDVERVDDGPRFIQADALTPVRVRVLRGGERPDPAAPVTLWQRRGRVGPFTQTTLTTLGTDEYGPLLQGQLDAAGAPCGSVVQYYFAVTTDRGAMMTVPRDGADRPWEAVVNQYTTVLSTGFETAASATGWLTAEPNAADPDTAATASRWLRGDPAGTVAQAEFDRTPLTGSQCMYTGVNIQGNAGGGDVDGGKTTLVSPAINLAGYADAELSFWLWYSNNRGALNSTDDELTVDVCTDGNAAGGAYSWSRALVIRAEAPIAQATGIWRKYAIRLAPAITPTSAVRVRVIASDVGAGSFVEAAFDDFEAIGLTCGRAACPGDFNGLGDVTVQDIFDFLQAYFAGSRQADVNGSGEVSVEDLFTFLGQWFVVCP